MSRKVRIVEVGPRDGLQNEKQLMTSARKLRLIRLLSETGIKHIEVGAFVSSRWVPQMAGSLSIAKKVRKLQEEGELESDIRYSALVPNARGMQDFLSSSLTELAFFTAASEAFAKKNINCTISESFQRLEAIKALLGRRRVKIRGYISTAFYCPYAGKVQPSKVLRVAERLMSEGCYEVSIGDTIGAATPKDVDRLLEKLPKLVPPKKIAMHFHDTRGTAIANVAASLEYGIRPFDSSIAGVGGCPYAPGSAGNVATEDLAFFLENMGYKTGVDMAALFKAGRYMAKTLSRPLPGKVLQAGLPKI